MNPLEITKEVESRTGIRVLTQTLLIASVLSNLLLAAGFFTIDRTHRETLVPPNITKTFWVEDDQVSDSYLEQMGLFILRNALDATPVSAEYQAKMILKYAAPASYGELERDLVANAKRMAREGVSTFFSVTGVTPDGMNRQVVFHGVLRTMLGDKTVSDVPKKYAIKFGQSNGRVFVKEMREINEKTSSDADSSDSSR